MSPWAKPQIDASGGRPPELSSTGVDPTAARRRREEAAKKYQPEVVNLLLVAETPPEGLDRYFYFEDVRTHDHLFWAVAKVLLHVEKPDRSTKPELLAQLKKKGVFLIDLKPDPTDESPLSQHVSALVDVCTKLRATKIVLIKVSVYDAAFEALRRARLPVIEERIPFPSTGRQKEFEEKFRAALEKAAPLLMDQAGEETFPSQGPPERQGMDGRAQPEEGVPLLGIRTDIDLAKAIMLHAFSRTCPDCGCKTKQQGCCCGCHAHFCDCHGAPRTLCEQAAQA